MSVQVTAAVGHDCARCTKPILPGRGLVWLSETDDLVHPACVEDGPETEETAA